MKTKKLELEVDCIGEQNGLTKTEEKALSNFFKQKKLKSTYSGIKQKKRSEKSVKSYA